LVPTIVGRILTLLILSYSYENRADLNPHTYYQFTKRRHFVMNFHRRFLSIDELGFRLEQIGDFFQLEYGILTVSWDEYGTWKIYLAEPVVAQSNDTIITGLCGNDNGNPFGE
jgi:hypothetical protein